MRLLWGLLATLALAQSDPWLATVSPLILPAEKKAYLALATNEEKQSFAQAFWRDKSITEQAYLARLAEVDSRFGSGRLGSGANTDQGRMLLALGPPTALHRTPSSRIFYETEIWYYDSAPRTGYSARLQFLFFRPRNLGLFKLYSPSTHTIRALLLPQSTTRGVFPINDLITPNDVRSRLNVPPTEDEIIEAALGVAKGITGVGNEEILSRALSPAQMLRRDPKTEVRSTFVAGAPSDTRILQFALGEMIVVDIQLRTRAARSVAIEAAYKATRLERTEIPLGHTSPQPVLLIQRLFLPPGQYLLSMEVDGVTTRQPLTVKPLPPGEVVGEAFPELAGEQRLALTPDARSAAARESFRRVVEIIAPR